MKHTFAGSYAGQRVRLSFDLEDLVEAGYVLVFAFFEGKLLMTRHSKRGWELPGGTREPGEWTLQTAIREVYEETGAELTAIEPIGQYVIEADSMEPMVKTIYVAKVGQMHPLPDGYETEAVRLFAEPPAADEVKADAAYSLILKDDVYAHALLRAREHRYAR
ncbi:NUDIX domain-containing protein [Tumebacillus lipolyticus]|uniref:NUDIX domain-containing protein n=1 Tax=Tumebacillus lipolyticus TaxID=1280370 RepID=A0ABW4ZZX2_9BACL